MEKEAGQIEVICNLYSTVQYSTLLMFLSDLQPIMDDTMGTGPREARRNLHHYTCTVQYST
jgi:hypothetical protein